MRKVTEPAREIDVVHETDVLVVGDGDPVDPGVTAAATAGRAHVRSPRPIALPAAITAHHSIAISLIRMSLPATTCSW